MVVVNRQHRRRRAFRIAGWIVLAILLAIAFHYAKKYEAEMLTDARHVESLAAPDRLIGQIIQISTTHQGKSTCLIRIRLNH
jgi:hypothetical protein